MLNRRGFLSGAALAGSGTAIGLGLGRAGLTQAVEAARFHKDSILGQGQLNKAWYRYKFIGQAVMDNQLNYYLGLAPSGLADVGDVLDTATRIDVGDEVSWFEAFSDTALRVQGYAEKAERGGHQLSAGSHYRRAGTYWRAGLIRYAKHHDPRMANAVEQATHCHTKAMALQGYNSQVVKIPYEGSWLFGRTYFSPRSEVAPTILLFQGLHAWPEETMWVIDGALKRGYHVLAFHGPGQGASLRLNGLTFRPDWENAVGPVVDYAETIPGFDSTKLILMGLSFGGFLAPRAASHEHRLHMLIADPGVVSWGRSMLKHFHDIPGIMPLHDRGPDAFNGAIEAISTVYPDARWYFEDVTWKHGMDSPHALVEDLERYDNTDGVANIRCKTCILDGEAEDATPGQSQELYDALTCEKELIYFDNSTASQTHCQGGGVVLAEAWMYDWLDDQFKV